MDNKIKQLWLFGILRLDNKEKQKDEFSQERDLLLSGKQFKEYIQFVRKKKKIDLDYINKLKIILKKHPYLKFKNKKIKLTNKNINKIIADSKKSEKLQVSFNNQLSIICNYINVRLNMDDIKEIRLLFNLSKVWEFPLIEYILTDTMPKPNFDPRVEFIKNTYKEDNRLKIEIFGNSRPEDIKRIWKTNVEGYLKFLPDYFRKGIRYKTTLDMGEQLEKWHKIGIRGKSLVEKAGKKFSPIQFSDDLVRKYRQRWRNYRDSRTR